MTSERPDFGQMVKSVGLFGGYDFLRFANIRKHKIRGRERRGDQARPRVPRGVVPPRPAARTGATRGCVPSSDAPRISESATGHAGSAASIANGDRYLGSGQRADWQRTRNVAVTGAAGRSAELPSYTSALALHKKAAESRYGGNGHNKSGGSKRGFLVTHASGLLCAHSDRDPRGCYTHNEGIVLVDTDLGLAPGSPDVVAGSKYQLRCASRAGPPGKLARVKAYQDTQRTLPFLSSRSSHPIQESVLPIDLADHGIKPFAVSQLTKDVTARRMPKNR